MASDVCNQGTVLRMIVQHLCYEVFEVIREVTLFFVLLVGLPVGVDAIANKEPVDGVFSSCHLVEGHGTTSHDEQNASKRK